MVPAWLSHSGVQQLLNMLLDRTERAELAQSTQARATTLDARTFPALYKAEFDGDRQELWDYVLSLAKMQWIDLRLDKGQPGMAQYERKPKVKVLDLVAIRNATGRLERNKSPMERWREAVFSELSATDIVKLSVSKYRIDIPGRLPGEIARQLNSLQALAGQPLMLREVSARLFWGQSKILDGRQALVAATLGLDECPFAEVPVQLQIHLPAEGFERILFIENQVTFERATRELSAQYAGYALIFCSGFKGSALRLRCEGGASLYFAAHGRIDDVSREAFKQWLTSTILLPCAFWGDLDYSGMAILKALRNSFPNIVAWEPGYAPMLKRLLAGEGHAADAANKKNQRVVESVGCSYADMTLLPALSLKGKFVDQESSWSD